jgi:hypothetical protein
MELAIVLSLAASICTATSSVCQRLGARHMEQAHHQDELRGFDPWLVLRLARQPIWVLGFCCMIGGFAFQISALHFGPLALVQPILAVELLLVFGYLALRGRVGEGHRTNWREWGAALAMAAGPLAASQPGFTICDPVVAILLGAFLFREHLGTSPVAIVAEMAGLIVLVFGVWTLSGSRLITGAPHSRPSPIADGGTGSELTRRLQ